MRTVVILSALQYVGVAFSTWTPEVKIYHIVKTPVLNCWHAHIVCQTYEMSLLTIQSDEEFRTLKEYIKRKYGRIESYWIGVVQDHYEWKWGYDEIIEGHQMMWHKGEPDYQDPKKLCVHTWEEDFDWKSSDCFRLLPFICELQLGKERRLSDGYSDFPFPGIFQHSAIAS